MPEYFITFRSVTGAQQGARLLGRAGVTYQLGRTPKSISALGCGYALRVRPNDAARAVGLLRRDGAPFQKVYQFPYGGVPAEVVI